MKLLKRLTSVLDATYCSSHLLDTWIRPLDGSAMIGTLASDGRLLHLVQPCRAWSCCQPHSVLYSLPIKGQGTSLILIDCTVSCSVVLASKSRCRGSSGPSIRSLVVDEERMRPGHWLGSVLCVPFSALTLIVGWQEGHPALKTNPVPLIPEVLFRNRWRRKTQGGTSWTGFTW